MPSAPIRWRQRVSDEGSIEAVPFDEPGQTVQRVPAVENIVEAVAEKVVAQRALLLLGAHRKTPEIETKPKISGILKYLITQKNPLDSIP